MMSNTESMSQHVAAAADAGAAAVPDGHVQPTRRWRPWEDSGIVVVSTGVNVSVPPPPPPGYMAWTSGRVGPSEPVNTTGGQFVRPRRVTNTPAFSRISSAGLSPTQTAGLSTSPSAGPSRIQDVGPSTSRVTCGGACNHTSCLQSTNCTPQSTSRTPTSTSRTQPSTNCAGATNNTRSRKVCKIFEIGIYCIIINLTSFSAHVIGLYLIFHE
jgi:hypothetical protein